MLRWPKPGLEFPGGSLSGSGGQSDWTEALGRLLAWLLERVGLLVGAGDVMSSSQQ